MTDAATAAALAVRRVSKSFAAIRALTDISLEFRPGVVTALLGENGAGKSTLIRISSGEMQPDLGEVLIAGTPERMRSPLEAMRLGVHVVHQEPQLINEMTVAENLFIDDLGEQSAVSVRRRKGLRDEAAKLLERLDMTDALPDLVEHCKNVSAAGRQMIDIVRALRRNPKVLFLDEPNSSLSRQETDRLFRVVRRLAAGGTAVALVSHRLGEVYEIADWIYILRDGQLAAEGSSAELPADVAIRQMAGAKRRVQREDQNQAARSPGRRGSETVDQAIELIGCSGPGFSEVDLEIRPGEIVGMAGLVGSGRTEIALAAIGQSRMQRGTVKVNGRVRSFRSPEAALRAGVAFISEERRNAVFYTQDIAFNMSVSTLPGLARLGLINRSKQIARMQQLADELGVRAESVRTPMKSLSGGNQQKVLLARALASDPDVLILDEPTRGVDVATKREIYQTLRRLARERNLAVWFISSDLEEVLELAERVVIVRHGRVVDDVAGGPDAAAVIASALGERLESALVDVVAQDVTSV